MASQPEDSDAVTKTGAARLALVMVGICLAVLLTGMVCMRTHLLMG